MSELPIATIKRIIRNSGKGKRVSETAASALSEALEEYAKEVTEQASEFAEHANRRTIRGEDIELALKQDS